jgi:hypothetical protein
MPAKKFILTEAFVPVIKGKLVEKDPGMGGIKLVYQENSVTIPLNPEKNLKQRVFLKPFKQVAAKTKLICEKEFGKGSWGNTSSPIANFWIEVTNTYEDIDQVIIRHDQITDQDLIKCLNNQLKDFILGHDEPVKLKLTDKARLFWDSLRNW